MTSRLQRLVFLCLLLGITLGASSCTTYMSVSIPGPYYGSSMTIGGPIGHPYY
jgi:hypothetical protein